MTFHPDRPKSLASKMILLMFRKSSICARDVVSKQLNQGDFSEFLMTCVRRYMMPFLENTTEEEKEELNRMLDEIGLPEKEAFAEEIKQLLAS